MRRRTLENRLWLLLLAAAISPFGAFSQSTADCEGAVVICGDMAITLQGGPGLPDFNNPNNDIGACHLTGEEQSVWLFFRFRQDMPENSILEFTITPFNGATTDYDFSVYAANTACDSLGSPIRCSYAWTFSNNSFSCGYCPLTGLGNGETDLSEGPFGNGFLAPLVAQPGQAFYVYINEFYDEDDNSGFFISFGGAAADYFDCVGNPNCDLVTVDLGADDIFCNDGNPYQLTTTTTFTTGFETYAWQGANGEEALMDDPASPSPRITFPDDFEGLVELVLQVSNGDCIHYDTLRLEVLPRLFLQIEGIDTLCLGSTGTLHAGPGFDSYLWSTGSTSPSITVSQGGIYTVTVTGNDGRCTLTDAMPVVGIPLPAPNLPANATACSGDSITLGPAGLFEAYAWNTGDTIFSITVSTSGYYFLTVTNEFGCDGVGLVQVNFLPAPAPQLEGEYGFCPGGTALVSATPGQGSYLWSTGETGTEISIAAPGDYSLTVTAPNNCATQAAFTVTAYPEPAVAIDGASSLCQGEQTLLEASSGFAEYVWQNGDTSSQLLISDGGLYSLVATDSNGCNASASLLVELLPMPDIDLPAELSFCENSMLVIDAGPGYAAYAWSNGSTAQSIQVQQGGSYGLTVTDAEGCQNSQLIDVAELPLPAPVLEGDFIFCQGASTTLTATVPGGYDAIIWSNGATGPIATFDAPGAYTVAVQAPNGCVREQAFVLAELDPTPVLIDGDTLICEGNTATLDAGSGYASYLWSNGATTHSIATDLGGQYAVTVTNALGCEGWDSMQVQIQPLPVVSLGADSAYYCRGQALALDAGSGLNSYLWSTGATSASIQVSTPGNYGVTVTDELGCVGQTAVEVVQVEPPLPEVAGDLNLCPGETTILSVVGDYAEYEWSTGASSPSIDVSQAGIYQLTLTDQYGCSGSAAIIVNALWAPTIEISGAADFCQGDSIVLRAGDHSSYLWSDGSTAPSLTVSASGEYSITVTNSVQCAASESVEIHALPLPEPSLPGEIEFCAGETATVEAAPGYSNYEWQDGTAGSTLIVSEPGWYYVQATDAYGCSGRDSVLAIGLPLPLPQVEGIAAICAGTPLTLTVTGADGDILWSNNSTSASTVIDQPGNYFVAVTDGKGCIGRADFSIDTLPSQPLAIEGPAGICPGDAAVLTGDDGFSDYLWSDGSTGQQLSVSSGGIYQLSAIDLNGCRSEASWAVELFPQPEAAIAGQSDFCAGSTTSLQAVGIFVEYLWSTGENVPVIVTGQPGLYSLMVTDANGCSAAAAITLAAIALPLADAGPGAQIDCRTESATLGNVSNDPPGLSYQWSGPGINPSNVGIPAPTVSLPGLYTLIVTDTVSGCVSMADQALVEDLRYEPDAVAAAEGRLDCNTPTAHLSGQGSSSGSAYAYQWLDAAGNPIAGAIGLSFDASQPGMYSLLVLDTITGCSAQASAAVQSDFAHPSANAGQGGRLTCIVTEWRLAGSINPNGPVAIAWSTAEGRILEGAETLHPLVNQPGWYFLTVTNLENGCQVRDSVWVQQDIAAPIADAGANQYLDCAVEEAVLDGSRSAQGPNLQYRWTSDNGFSLSGQLQAEVNQPGAYILTVTSLGNGCSSSDTALVELIDNFLLGFESDAVPPRCYGEQNGLIAINAVNGGTAPFLYSINGAPFSSAAVFSNLGAGQYALQVQDARGCEYETDILLPEGNIVLLDVGEDQEIKLGEQAWLHAITNLGPEEIASFRWTPAEGLPCDTCLLTRPRPLETTLFTATIVDTAGCRATDRLRIIVRKDRGVYIPNAFSPNLDGANDEFVVYGGPDVTLVKRFLIFNRWGGKVFEESDFPPNNPAHGWDGNFQGQPLQSAVFAYFVEIEFIDGTTELFKGDVTLVR